MEKASSTALKVLGILLLAAAALKDRRLLTEPVANSDIWSYRPFLILTVEFELALGIWLLSGLFKKAAWLAGNEDFLRIALIAVPPYGRYLGHKGPVSENSPCTLGKLDQSKEWFVTTPATALLTDGQVKSAWEEKAPDFGTILERMAKNTKRPEKSRFLTSTNNLTAALYYERR